MSYEAICKGCGKPIVWAKDKTGKNIPLDPRAVIFEIVRDFTGSRVAQIYTGEEFMVTHFATCSRANDFSSSRR